MDDNGGAAERAFKALTTEVSGTRRAVQALQESLEQRRPVDTTETLGVIVSRLNTVAQSLAVMEKHPALKLTPEQHARAVVLAGEGLLREAVQKFDGAARDFTFAQRELVQTVGTIRERHQQWEWLAWTGIAAFFLGLLISPMFARVLPFGWDGQVAAFIMNADRWGAGAKLMEAASPEAWQELQAEAALFQPNAAAITACRAAATKAKQPQRCSIEVPLAK
jgi:Family of unknown function (DUF6118)